MKRNPTQKNTVSAVPVTERNLSGWRPLPARSILAPAAALLLCAAFTASAQTFQPQPTTVDLWAGTQDFVQFGLASLTFPTAGAILQGSAISPITGRPVRHMWYGDPINGLCRVDPEMDKEVPAVAGIGGHFGQVLSCIASIQATGFKPGQVAFDELTNTMYAVNVSTGGAAVVRMHYVPTGDNGQGTLDPIRVETLMGTQTGHNGTGGCPLIADPTTGAIPVQPDAASLSPDGNLYIGFKRGGAVVRITNPAFMDPGNPTDCKNNIQVPLFSADERLGVGHTFGLGWIGHTLFGADNIAPWVHFNADQCLTPINGNQRCGPTTSTEILAAFVAGPSGGVISDAIFPNFPGNTLYAAQPGVVTKITNVLTVGNLTLNENYGGTFCFITGLTADTRDLANEPLYVGADCTQGGINGAAQIWRVRPSAPAAAPPAAPTNVTAVAAVGQASVTWFPTPNGQPVTQYLVRTFSASGGGTGVPDVVVNSTPGTSLVGNSVTVTGLVNGLAVKFEVEAINNLGSSAFSAPSNVVTPQVLTAPGAPTGVVATSGIASSTIAWTAPANTGGSPITSYSVTARLNGVASGSPIGVSGTTTGVNFTGLTNGKTYTFTVHATNAIGSSPESAPSAAVTPGLPPGAPDMQINMSSPALVNSGSFVTFTMIVTNNGPQPAPVVVLNDLLPVPFQSSTTTQGACSITGFSFSCNLGTMPAGASATVTATVAIGAAPVTNTATVETHSATNAVLVDPNPANNTASSTTSIAPPLIPPAGGGGGGATGAADIQVTGSAQNGGPSVGSGDTFTWQIRANKGTASGVVFTLSMPPGLQFNSAFAGQGICSGLSPGSFGGTLTCSLGTLSGNQVNVTVGFTPVQPGNIATTGSATFNGTDSNPANNLFTVNVNAK